MTAQKQLLEKKFKAGNVEFNDAMQLISIYLQMGQSAQADALAKQMLNSGTMQPQMIMQLAQHLAKARRFPMVELALKKYTEAQPKDHQGWINLAGLQLILKKPGEMWVSLGKAIEVGGEPARNQIRKDKRFDTIRRTKEYQKLIPLPKPGTMGLAPLPGM